MTPANAPQEEYDTICGICPAGCWVRAQLENGRLVSVKAQPDHPLGMICRLGERSPEIVYSPDRLKHPMKRVGPKGTFDFRPISWDEAYKEIVASLEKTKAAFGPEATAIYTGRGSFDLAMCDLFQPRDTAVSSASSVLFPFGSPNTFGVGALCYVSFAMIAPHVTMGGMLINMDSEIEDAELIVVWGTNPATDCPPLAHHQILAAKAKGAEVVVIDPRQTATAKATDAEWIPIRPGTDGALALSMIQVLIEEDLLDEDFIDDWTVGFDDLKRYVQHFTPEAVAQTTSVPAEVTRQLARRIHKARGAAPVMYSGLEYSDSGVQAIRASQILWALAGQLDVPGGRTFKMRENVFPINKEGLVANPDVAKAIGRDRFPVYSQYRGESHAISLPEAVLEGRPYPIRNMIVLGGSMITAWPEPDVWRRTLDKLDFLVTIDRQLTADAAYADIVLPATTGYENTSYMVYGPLFRIREKLIEPLGEARNDFFILAELARRLGYGELYPQTEDELLDHVLKSSGETAASVRAAGGTAKVQTAMIQYKKWGKGLLRADGRPGFETPSGKLEIASTILEEHGYDPLPVYTEPKEGPLSRADLVEKFPLVFNSGSRVTTDFRSQHHGVPSLIAEAPEPRVTMNTADARSRGIATGDEVYVSTERGRAKFRALITDDIIPGAIDANMGGGGPIGPEAWRDCNVNDLTDLKRYDPISGFPVYKALLCEVEPVKARAAGEENGSNEGKEQVPNTVEELLAEEKARKNPAEKYSGRSKLENAAQSAGRKADERRGEGSVHEIHDRAESEDNAANRVFGRVSRTPQRATKRRTIYFDHNATTALDPEALAAMEPFLREDYGNPSSIHGLGARAHDAVESARRVLARALNTTARRLVLTGGGSEADNLAIKGVALAYRDKGRHIITSAVEHPAVLAACRSLENQGFEVTFLPVTRAGLVEPGDLKAALRSDTTLVSIMTANNETGTIQPIAQLASIAKERGVPFHTDAVQAFGKIPVNVESLGVDLLTVSSHKIHGPKGVGALFVRRGVSIDPLIGGGKQESGLRAGTENVPGIVGFATAADLALRRLPKMDEVAALRDRLQNSVLKLVPEAMVNGSLTDRLPNTLNVTLPGFRGESVVFKLDRLGIALSSGSACKSGSPDPSHALLALGLTEDEAHCALRFSLGTGNTAEEIDQTIEALEELVREAADSVRFVPCR